MLNFNESQSKIKVDCQACSFGCFFVGSGYGGTAGSSKARKRLDGWMGGGRVDAVEQSLQFCRDPAEGVRRDALEADGGARVKFGVIIFWRRRREGECAKRTRFLGSEREVV